VGDAVTITMNVTGGCCRTGNNHCQEDLWAHPQLAKIAANGEDMTMLNGITAEQIRDACDAVYRPNDFRDAPSQVFVDQFSGDPPTTFVRVSFPRYFTGKAASELSRLAEVLQERHGHAENVVVCIYFRRINPHDLALHSIAIADR